MRLFGMGFYDGSNSHLAIATASSVDGSISSWLQVIPNSWWSGDWAGVWLTGPNTVTALINDSSSSGSSGANFRCCEINLGNGTATVKGKYQGGTNNNGSRLTSSFRDSNGNIYVSGNSAEIPTVGSFDIGFIAKFDSNFNRLWIKGFGTSSQNNYGMSGMTVDSSGNIYWGYRYRDTVLNNWIPILMKMDSSGAIIWEKNLQPSPTVM